MKIFLLLLLSCIGALAQGGAYCTMSTWEPRNLLTKAGLVASFDPGNTNTLTHNGVATAGTSISKMVDRTGLGHDLTNATAANQPLVSRVDNAGNICKYSDDLTQSPWTATSATKTSANTLTFTAQNGQVIQDVPTASGLSYTFSFWARTNSGNTALTILHLNSATGNSTSQTINGTLTQYSVTVLGKSGAGGAVSFGIRDANAAGFGAIIFTNMQVRVSTWDNTYVQTTTVPIFAGLSGRPVLYFDGSAYSLATANFTLNQPQNVYLGVNQWTSTSSRGIIDGTTAAKMLLRQGTSPKIGWRSNSGTDIAQNSDLTIGAWGAITATQDGANSRIKVNNGTVATGDVGFTADAGGLTLGKQPGGSPVNMLCSRVIICSKTNAPAEENYIAWGVKKQAGVY